MADVLTEWLADPSAARDLQQYERFKFGSEELARLLSNPPAACDLERQVLNAALPSVLSTGRALLIRELTEPQAREALAVLRFAADFVEFGRSGRTYTRSQIIRTDSSPIDARLSNLQMRRIDDNTVLVTYDSAAVYNGKTEHARRSSIWTKSDAGWVMRFHQGTPFNP